MEVNKYLKKINKFNRDSHDHFLIVIIENLSKIGNETIEICHFVELNITAIRKILKSFDKKMLDVSM